MINYVRVLIKYVYVILLYVNDAYYVRNNYYVLTWYIFCAMALLVADYAFSNTELWGEGC